MYNQRQDSWNQGLHKKLRETDSIVKMIIRLCNHQWINQSMNQPKNISPDMKWLKSTKFELFKSSVLESMNTSVLDSFLLINKKSSDISQKKIQELLLAKTAKIVIEQYGRWIEISQSSLLKSINHRPPRQTYFTRNPIKSINQATLNKPQWALRPWSPGCHECAAEYSPTCNHAGTTGAVPVSLRGFAGICDLQIDMPILWAPSRINPRTSRWSVPVPFHTENGMSNRSLPPFSEIIFAPICLQTLKKIQPKQSRKINPAFLSAKSTSKFPDSHSASNKKNPFSWKNTPDHMVGCVIYTESDKKKHLRKRISEAEAQTEFGSWQNGPINEFDLCEKSGIWSPG